MAVPGTIVRAPQLANAQRKAATSGRWFDGCCGDGSELTSALADALQSNRALRPLPMELPIWRCSTPEYSLPRSNDVGYSWADTCQQSPKRPLPLRDARWAALQAGPPPGTHRQTWATSSHSGVNRRKSDLHEVRPVARALLDIVVASLRRSLRRSVGRTACGCGEDVWVLEILRRLPEHRARDPSRSTLKFAGHSAHAGPAACPLCRAAPRAERTGCAAGK